MTLTNTPNAHMKYAWLGAVFLQNILLLAVNFTLNVSTRFAY